MSSSRRVKKGPGRRPQSAKRQRFMELRAKGWSISAAGREVGVSRSAANNWARGYKTYRRGKAVGFAPALDRLAVRQVLEMLGFQGWVYPYQSIIFDERSGQAFGFWRQLSTFHAPNGEPYEIKGLGGSWFQYSGHRSWSWQRDMFDVGVATTTMLEVLSDGNSSPQLDERMKLIAAGNMPGHSSHD